MIIILETQYIDLGMHTVYSFFFFFNSFSREEIEKQKAHERYMRLQEQGKTEQARKDLGNPLSMINSLV